MKALMTLGLLCGVSLMTGADALAKSGTSFKPTGKTEMGGQEDTLVKSSAISILP